ncbi:hypothetical protein LCGC14_2000840 [marine sediment metagenome]|uniref:Uncharacterized protein n=1 Tax=marine sediment metagenome TaxID=412755 RepID=A0A0F9FR22_9ZZZZ
MFRKKKKKEEIVQPEEVPEVEEPEEELPTPPEPPKEVKKSKKVGETTLEVKGEFSLDIEEMALFAQLAVSSEEYKIYQQGLVGQRLDKIVTEYNKAVGGKSEVPSKDTDEETLPE